MFVYVESDSSITAFCEDGGISENEHWKSTMSAISEPITESHGVPIYKFVNGKVTERSAEELEVDLAALTEPVPSSRETELEARVAELEAALDALLTGEVE